jgi:hypothetical protein
VVLQNYNGVLIMLDSRTGAAMSEGPADYGAENGGSYGSGSYSDVKKGVATSGASGSKANFDKQLDDEIPF